MDYKLAASAITFEDDHCDVKKKVEAMYVRLELDCNMVGVKSAVRALALAVTTRTQVRRQCNSTFLGKFGCTCVLKCVLSTVWSPFGVLKGGLVTETRSPSFSRSSLPECPTTCWENMGVERYFYIPQSDQPPRPTPFGQY